MYTVEYEHETIEIVILDDKGYEDDLKIEVEDTGVYISQWNSILNEEHILGSQQAMDGTYCG